MALRRPSNESRKYVDQPNDYPPLIQKDSAPSRQSKPTAVKATNSNSYRDIILNSVRQQNHFITQGNYKATCFDYRLVILRPILSIVSQDAMHTLGSHRVYIHGIHRLNRFN